MTPLRSSLLAVLPTALLGIAVPPAQAADVIVQNGRYVVVAPPPPPPVVVPAPPPPVVVAGPYYYGGYWGPRPAYVPTAGVSRTVVRGPNCTWRTTRVWVGGRYVMRRVRVC
ncbi:hypothetical protein PQJ75_01565 [Rhodoplanes sp. TEM]|uniref:Uncharacterized protein n=1 Tax=Rhodoplanes tepidamans TaxID=200616 RepID=A0ABT5J9G4_RHOTP|nr:MULTISPECIES: hypothetical protein [Rhodoplanes]MDC7786221.1 hypothetical protein [Rhodoplanes tepidamans]MDC7982408.1 hypothetical protein [Rhodoplanes sp. TEM]MDQ0355020.1 hypothetical protein [Rhodoplanes tepidamans]